MQPDSVLRSQVERQCLDYYARRDDACIIEQLDGQPCWPGRRRGSVTSCTSSSCRHGSRRVAAGAAALRSRGQRSPHSFLAHRRPTPTAPPYRVDAVVFIAACRRNSWTLCWPGPPGGYGPAIQVAGVGSAVLPFADVGHLKVYPPWRCNFHLASGGDVPLPVRPGAVRAGGPAALADEALRPSSTAPMVNLAAVSQLAAGEFWMQAAHGSLSPAGRPACPHGAERLSGKETEIKKGPRRPGRASAGCRGLCEIQWISSLCNAPPTDRAGMPAVWTREGQCPHRRAE